MGYELPVRQALDATAAMERALEADFDVERGGFTWWHGYGLDGVALTGIMDYLYGLVAAVEENLRTAAVHLADHREARHADDFALIKHLRENGRVPSYHERTKLEARREARIHAHEAGVLRATGSVLDALAGVVVGVGGFSTNILRADLGLLQPLTDGPDYPGPEVRGRLKATEKALDPDDLQGSLLRSVRSSLRYAGPDGWLEWTQFSRNDRVHRASRIKMSFFGNDGKVAQPLTRQPDHAATLGFRSANGLGTMLLTEDSQTTLNGVVESVNFAVVGSFIACEELWHRRRDHPDLIAQPAGQWPSAKPPRSTTFNGYAPNTIVPPDNLSVMVNPKTGRRLRAAKVLDGDYPMTT